MALDIFRLQYENNTLYRGYVDAIRVNPEDVNCLESIPFLPIQFFKSGKVVTTHFDPAIVFESSGTSGSATSRHYIKEPSIYSKSFLNAFRIFYGKPGDWCILGLLPGYLERKNSSLVYMVNELVRISGSSCSGFYLHDHKTLYKTLVHNEIIGQPTLLIGVTHALLDFAEKYSMNLQHTVIMETGGMKGRREELTREEVHSILKKRLNVDTVHSEYGMTELHSQAYSRENGRFHCPPWMKVLAREQKDPLSVTENRQGIKPFTGVLNIIDLANIYSCCFIGTEDLGRIFRDGTFEVLGRRDTSDLRGCSLLTA